MIRRVTWLAICGAALLALGCGPKDKAPQNAVTAQEDLPDEWSGVSFDEELGAMDDGFAVAADDSACGNLLELEPIAMLGRLTEEQIVCLDHRVRHEARQTNKDKISRVLMADAWAKGDRHRWEGAVRRHLEEIDQSDPDLSYLFALYLSKQGFQAGYEAIRYAELALENKDQWGPEQHAERVEALYKVRALAAQALWYHWEDEFLHDKSRNTSDQVDKWRANAKSMAKEWLSWAYLSGEPWHVAYDMCVSAAGTLGYCDIGFEGAAQADGAP